MRLINFEKMICILLFVTLDMTGKKAQSALDAFNLKKMETRTNHGQVKCQQVFLQSLSLVPS